MRWLRSVLALWLVIITVGTSYAAEPLLVVEDNDWLGPVASDTIPLLAAPNVKLLGFTTVTGDGWSAEGAADLLRFLEIARRTEVPVVPGAVYPLVNSYARVHAWEQAYGKLIWKGAWNEAAPGNDFHPTDPYKIPHNPAGEPTTKPAAGTAVQFLIDQVHRYPHRVTILAAGPLTNLALAIRLDPDFAGLAKELIFMGGFVDTNLQQVTSDANFATDFNIWFDPEAADIVLTAPWTKITSVGAISNDTMMTPTLKARIAAKKTAITDLIQKYSLPLPLWDELAAAITVDTAIVTRETLAYMDVDTDHGMYYGTTHVWPEATRPHMGERPVYIVDAIDTDRFVNEFVAWAQSLPAK
jgi:inosine-uridine nucleoside N-ribohydrolase